MSNNDEVLVSGHAFKEMLKQVDPATKIEELKKELAETSSPSKRDDIVKKIKYLNGLISTGMKPEEAYVIHNLPVLPPVHRPAMVMGGNKIEFADLNNLYKDHMTVNLGLRGVVDALDPSMLTTERADAYKGIKAIMGLGDPISPNSKGRGLTGIMKQIGGKTGPKTGTFHAKILSKKQDFSGRATIYAEPNLGFNEVAVPKDVLWTMYKFHILRDLAKRGYNYVDAEKAYNDRNNVASSAFNKSITNIPLFVNRAPTLMKSNITALFPKPISGNTMGINPIHLPFFAGDFDGDAMSIYLPMTPEAVEEAKNKALPEHQIYDYRKGLKQSLVAPGHEAILGSVHMTEPDMKQEVKRFKSEKEVLEALKAGTIKENTPIEIG